MSRRLAGQGVIHVRDEDGVDHVFTPGETVPSWAAKQITNPKAWGGEPADDGDADGTAGVTDPPPPPPVIPPPMGGPGSGVAEWLAYAGSLNVEVPEESRGKRDEVIAVLRAAGKPVERISD